MNDTQGFQVMFKRKDSQKVEKKYFLATSEANAIWKTKMVAGSDITIEHVEIFMN